MAQEAVEMNGKNSRGADFQTVRLSHSPSLFVLMTVLFKRTDARHNLLRVSLALARALCGQQVTQWSPAE